jgi:hypothetical protein
MLGLTKDEIKAMIDEALQQAESEYMAEMRHIPPGPQSSLRPADMELIARLMATSDRLIFSWLSRLIIRITLENNRRLAGQIANRPLRPEE